ncbi:MAG: anion permease [Clostridia bacterium]|nr:anion permease [Clostridia bacterium]
MAAIIATSIFVVMFALIIMEKIPRHLVTLCCGLLTLVVVFGLIMRDGSAVWETLNLKAFVSPSFWYAAGEGGESGGVNWETITFIAGMMVMVEGMARVGFFRWLCMRIAKLVKCKTTAVFVTFMIMSAVLSMFIDSITVILFLAAVTIELGTLLKFNPIPMILAEIFCANLGGSATMCGDPPNIIIGTALGYTFGEFLTNTGIIAGICLVFVVFYFLLVFKKDLKSAEKVDASALPDPKEAILDKTGFIISTCIFLLAVVLLITHAQTHLTVASIGVGIALITLLTAPKHIGEMLKKVDYKTLLFFVGLFIVVNGLEVTGVLEMIANFIKNISGGNLFVMIGIILWISAIASAFVDNIPFAATMVPIIQSLAPEATLLQTLAWGLSVGTDIGGSATPIGASANVVGISVANKNGYKIGWGKYCAKLAPATVLVLAISTLFIFLRYKTILGG